MVGIIPAHAGLTRLQQSLRQFARDHPRACGAHTSILPISVAMRGSSPRMRGSQPPMCMVRRPHGIIPAHAGLTRRALKPLVLLGDHPRACGAHPCWSLSEMPSAGSSPRMRGSPAEKRHEESTRGIIPAHAGLTRKSMPS